ncbi:hypothetical protein [Kribbella sp. DT2]|uniref:hypothetical protein n=1 Tax=Kribbella sp. DT2 TaxID=3393427 RepID=UPI003CF432B9
MPRRRPGQVRADGCGVWECCTPADELLELFAIVEHNLPRRDARRFRARLEKLDELW